MTKENNPVREPRKYRVSLVEQKTERVVWQRHFTKTLLWLSVIAAVLIGAALVWCLIAFTPLRTTIPGYPDARTRNMAVQNALKIDSLERVITRWDLYAENLRRVVAGEQPINIDSVLRVKSPVDSLPADAAALAGKAARRPSKAGISFRRSRASCRRNMIRSSTLTSTFRPPPVRPSFLSWTGRWCSPAGATRWAIPSESSMRVTSCPSTSVTKSFSRRSGTK